MSKKQFRKIKRIILIIFGAALMGVGSYFFLFRANIASGGVGGMSLLINNLFPQIKIGYMATFLNLILFAIGLKILGREFGMYTLIGTVSYSVALIVYESIWPVAPMIVQDDIVNLIVGSAFMGVGLGLVFNQNASTGGTDILAKIIDKYTSIGIGTALALADAMVIVIAIFVLGIEKAIYGVIAVGLTSVFVDKVLSGFNTLIQMTIISNDVDIINDYINQELNRGTTLYKAVGGYTKHDKRILMTIVDRSQYVKIKKFINKIDDNAFVFINTTNEVIGEGFTKEVE